MQLVKHIKQGRVLYFTKSEELITINENDYYRWIAFGDVIQSIMNKRKPYLLTLPHHIAMLLPLIFFRPKLIVELGLGGGNFARYLSQLNEEITFTSIERNQHVIQNFYQYFNPLQSSVKVIHQCAEGWIKAKNSQRPSDKDIDWLICDIYQQQLTSFKETIDLLEVFMTAVTPNTCFSLNLPDANHTEINLCLTVLQQLQTNHRVVYFYVPNYLNIVIHLLPLHWPIDKKINWSRYSYLNKRVFSRWTKYWQHLNEI